MITDAIVTGLLEVLRAMLSLLPSWELSLEGISSGATTIAGHIAWANGYLPVATLALCIAALWGYRVVLIAYSALRELWDALPFT